jgi:hypothetical protein
MTTVADAHRTARRVSLDAGCGTGRALPTCGPRSARVVGVDLVPDPLRRLTNRTGW